MWQRLSETAPNAVDSFKAAADAFDKEDYKEAARLYEIVLKQAPTFDVAMRELGGAYIKIGRLKEGLALQEKAVQQDRSPENLSNLAYSLASQRDKPEARGNDERAYILIEEAVNKNTNTKDPSYLVLQAQLAFQLNRETDFRNATKTLQDRFPDLMITHVFVAERAAIDEDWFTAETEIKKAGAMGLPQEDVNQFLASGIHTRVTVWLSAYISAGCVIVWALGLAALFLVGKVMSRKTLDSLETDDPNMEINTGQTSLRKFYRALINVAGIYYYLSIPIVILLTIAIAGSILYGILMAGYIPFKLVALIVIGTLATVFQMIKSVVVRKKREEPGRSLTFAEAPGLWEMVKNVAQSVNTRPIDDIRIMPGSDFAVYEHGKLAEKRQDRAKRVLMLGTGLLNGFRQNAFRAVLAHEYGHFTHRDTAGGEIAFRVEADIMELAKGMYQSRVSIKWNPAFQFLRLYHLIFRRISYGATRLQEVLADRVAIRNFGAASFEEGLTHVVRRSVEFKMLAENELNEAYQSNRAIQNVYNLADIDAEDLKGKIHDEVNKSLNRLTTEDDTHPSPNERFRLASKIISKTDLPEDGMVWDLFANRDELTNEMHGIIKKRVMTARA